MTISTAIRSITPAVIALLTPACSTLRTVEAPVGQKNTGRAFSGLHYFLPRGTISIEGSKGSDAAAEAAKYIITITRQNEADRKDRYRLITSANYLYDDTANFAITEKGLLNGVVTTKSDPRIKDIIDAFADAAVNVGKIVIKLNTGITPGQSLPSNSWAIYLYDKLTDPRTAGVHYYTEAGGPYAVVATDEKDWSIFASHEVLEMLSDPKTDTFHRAPDPNGTVGDVEYLVEVCDPCQHASNGYEIDDVLVSDFYGKGYFDTWRTEGRFSQNNKLVRPLQILPGGYLSFRDGVGDMYVATSDGVSPAAYTSISGFNRMPGDSVRERMDFYSATMAGVGCFADIGRNWTYHAKPPQVRGLQGPKAFEVTQAKRSEAQCRHFKAVCRAVAAWDRKMSRSKKS